MPVHLREGEAVNISTADVVRHFLRREASKPEYTGQGGSIRSWCELLDDQLIERARQFARERPDTNPALAYMVGMPGAEFSRKIAKWERLTVRTADVYVWAMAPLVDEDLSKVRGNLSAFAHRFAAQYPDEFPAGRPLPAGDDAVIIAIAQRRDSKEGAFELVDGAHRLVSMCRQGVSTVEAILGCPR